MRYNPWFKAVYERVTGKQKTRKKKAAIALARKIAVIAWAMLRDEKDWDPETMLTTTRMFNAGDITPQVETLKAMKPKENSDQRKSRLRREARQTRQDSATTQTQTQPEPNASSKTPTVKATSPTSCVSSGCRKSDSKRSATKSTATSTKAAGQSTTKTRRARKPVSAS